MDEEMREAWRELQASDGTDIDAARRLLRALERTQENLDPLAGITVWICRYTHKHGTDSGVYQTAEDAWNAALRIAYEYWDEEIGDEEIPENPQEVLRLYNDRTNEYLEIEDRRITPTPSPEAFRPAKCDRCSGNHETEVCDDDSEEENDSNAPNLEA